MTFSCFVFIDHFTLCKNDVHLFNNEGHFSINKSSSKYSNTSKDIHICISSIYKKVQKYIYIPNVHQNNFIFTYYPVKIFDSKQFYLAFHILPISHP